MDVYVKMYEAAGDILIAVCDENTLGKKFSFKDTLFEVKESFYKGEKKKLDEIRPILEKATVLNLVGYETIKKCVEWGYIKEANVLEMGKTAHAQMVRA
ncbi:MAG: DUF424 family protein [Euryarchaeota archaeon]|nr:DUF424 family protein [Euryarchaeota archaeon]